MRKLFIFLIAVLLTATVWAQSPEKMSYQAVIRNSSDVLVTNTQIGMQISILQTSIFGASVYVETQNPTTNVNGLVSIEIGSGIVLHGEFSEINWAAGPYFIKTETDPTGGENYTITGISQLLSVPYALHAKTAENVENINIDYENVNNTPDLSNFDQDATDDFDGDYTNLVNAPDFTGWDTDVTDDFDGDYTNLANAPDFTGWDTNDSDDFSGSYNNLSDLPTNLDTDATDDFSGDFNDLTNQPDMSIYATKDMASENITNLADPVNAQDAATKVYVDELKSMILDLQAEVGVTDSRDETHYSAVRIGNQVWMAENLKYLPSVVAPDTESDTDAYYYVYGYEGTDVNAAKQEANYQTYGVLYNWPAAMAGSTSSEANPSGVQGICPTGWHLPSNDEWTQLEMALGMSQADADNIGWRGTDEGSQLADNTLLWWSGGLRTNSNFGASGFKALPTGTRSTGGAFLNICRSTTWWSATEYDTSEVWFRSLYYDYSNIYSRYCLKEFGFPVRCIRN